MIDLADVRAESERYGPIAYLATVSPSATPYVSPVAVAWRGDELLAFVATNEAKVANVRDNAKVSVHFAVSEATNWDSCVVWGDARMADTTAERTELWSAMGYDLDQFEPGGPGADSHVFIVMKPTKAVILRSYGIQGRDEWRA